MDFVEKDECPNVMGLVRTEPIGELVFRQDRNPNPSIREMHFPDRGVIFPCSISNREKVAVGINHAY